MSLDAMVREMFAEGHEQTVTGNKGKHNAFAHTFTCDPNAWPDESKAYIYDYGVGQNLGDCFRSALSAALKKDPTLDAKGCTKVVQDTIASRIADLAAGNIPTMGASLEVREAKAILKESKFDIPKGVNTRAQLEAHFKTLKTPKKVTFKVLWESAEARAIITREAAKAKSATANPFK